MKVKFVPQNVEYEIKPGESVMHVAQDHGIYIKSVCKGVPSCAECRVRVLEGDHNVLPPGSEELSLIGTGHFIDRRRLSCQLKCFGDITVDMNEQIAKEQGLIVGQKKKNAMKNDRVEQAVVIRSEERSSREDDRSPRPPTVEAEERDANAGPEGDGTGAKRRRRRRGKGGGANREGGPQVSPPNAGGGRPSGGPHAGGGRSAGPPNAGGAPSRPSASSGGPSRPNSGGGSGSKGSPTN